MIEIKNNDEILSKYFVYALVDSCKNEVRYIGRTSIGVDEPRVYFKTPKTKEEKRRYVYRMMQKLIKSGTQPKIFVLEYFELTNAINENLNNSEIFFISYFKNLGHRLTNLTCGGQGSLGLVKNSELYYLFICPICKSKENGRHHPNKKFCSHECYSKSLINKPSTKRKLIKCLNDGKIYDCSETARKAYGLSKSNVTAVANGDREFTFGYKFSYVNEEEINDSLVINNKTVIVVPKLKRVYEAKIVNCAVCSKEVRGKGSRRKYCSQDCYNENKKNMGDATREKLSTASKRRWEKQRNIASAGVSFDA